MVTLCKKTSIACVALMFMSISAWAADISAPLQPYNNTSLYRVTWSGGILAGYLTFDAHETASDYEITVQSKAVGALRLATKHKSNLKTEGVKQGDHYIPQRFTGNFIGRNETRDITLDYDKNGNLMAENYVSPKPESNNRPKVPDELKINALDPLTAFYIQRLLIYKALQQGQKDFTLRYYDGRRLTDMQYQVDGLSTLTVDNKSTQVLNVAVTRIPVAGYKEKELKEMAEKTMKVYFSFSTDGKLTPLRFIVDAKMGAFHATYLESCASMESCLKKMK